MSGSSKARGKPAEAEACFRQAVRLRPTYGEAHNNLGNALRELDRLEEAVASLRQAARLLPTSAEVHNNLGNTLRQQGRLDEAAACLEQALRLQPRYPLALSNLGVTLLEQGRLEEAADRLRQALREQPDLAEAHNNLGAVLLEQGRPREALEHIEQALRLQPENFAARKNRAMAWLLQGNFEKGWAEYECRWRCKELPPRPFPQPAWDGSPLEGRTILLHAEQGLGDTIQFVRYAPLVKQRGGRVIVECQPALRPLLAGCSGIDQLVVRGSALPPFDVHAPLLSLPRLFQTTLQTVPARVPYVAAESGLRDHWRCELAPLRGFKVGIAWQGNPKYPRDRQRSVPLTHFAALARVPGVYLLSLQKGPGSEQLETLRDRLPVLSLGGLVDGPAGPFMDTAAIMANLDLVVTSDSALAHLAGALAVPVWVALPHAPDWRWLLGREDSPWYPTLRLFRQTEPGNWAAVFERMADSLRRLVAERKPARRILVEISPGELLDRIAALEIKSERLTEPAQLAQVHGELAAFQAVRNESLPGSPDLDGLIAAFQAAHAALWQAEDDLRACERAGYFGPRFIELARAVCRGNEERGALKRQINDLLGR